MNLNSKNTDEEEHRKQMVNLASRIVFDMYPQLAQAAKKQATPIPDQAKIKKLAHHLTFDIPTDAELVETAPLIAHKLKHLKSRIEMSITLESLVDEGECERKEEVDGSLRYFQAQRHRSPNPGSARSESDSTVKDWMYDVIDGEIMAALMGELDKSFPKICRLVEAALSLEDN